MLNIDLGELPGDDERLYEAAGLANIACGGHAGDEASMTEAVARCLRHGVRVGAHPSYPDREGFGRRALAMGPAAVVAAVRAQCLSLRRVAEAQGAQVVAMKPHGALYHAANGDPALARAVLEGCVEALGREVQVVGPPLGALRDEAMGMGLSYWREAFADRGLAPDGSLLPRGVPGALIADPARAAAQARWLVQRDEVETICVHGDTPGAVAIAHAVREVLEVSGGRLRPLGEAACRFELPSFTDRRALLHALRAVEGVAEVSFGEREGAVIFAEPHVRAEALAEVEAVLAQSPMRSERERTAPRVIRVRYDGEDLREVAARCGLAEEDVVTLHVSRVYEVTTVGFLPGFGYLRELDERLALPRRPSPRARVPAGAVAIAERMTAVYPFTSPGGWHLIGSAVDFQAFDVRSGAALQPGDLVRFERVG